MELIQLVGEQTVSISLALTVMYFYNQLVISFLKERKEIIEANRVERQEWLATSSSYLNTVIQLVHTATEGLTQMKAEIHSLRNALQPFMLRQEKGNTHDS